MLNKAENYGNYVIESHTPEWFRAERYDYCEPFFEEDHMRHGKGIHFLAQMFLSIFF